MGDRSQVDEVWEHGGEHISRIYLQVLQVLREGWWCDMFQATLGRLGEQCQALFMCSTQCS
jgi:hypothetical protein